MSNENLREIHDVDFKMLKSVTDVFEKNNLKYFLIAGTLLGAVRHKGFIPWDDDLDIGVPRESYELFLSKYANDLPDRYRVQNFKTDEESKYYVTRVLDTKVKVKELRDSSATSEMTFASIDLFPMDGTPNNFYLRKLFIFHVLFLRMLASMSESNNIDMMRKRNPFETMLVRIVKFLPIDKYLDRQKIFFRLDEVLTKYSINNSKYVGSLMGAYREKELFSSDYIKELKRLKFENELFYAPSDWNGYLTHMYGDYMKIPSMEDIKRKRHFEVIKED